jgi:hypothetical protein
VRRREPSKFRIALAFVAVTMAAAALGVLVVLPAALDSAAVDAPALVAARPGGAPSEGGDVQTQGASPHPLSPLRAI